MADTVERIIIDDTQAIKALNNLSKQLNTTSDDFNELNEEIEKGSKDSSDAFIKNNKKVNESLDDTAKRQREAAKNTEDAIKNTNVLGVSLNDVTTKLKLYRDGLVTGLRAMTNVNKLTFDQRRNIIGLSKALGGGRAAFIGLAKAANIAKVSIASTGIGLLVIGLVSVISALKTTQNGMDSLSVATSYVSGSFSVLQQKVNGLGTSIIKSLGKGEDNIFKTMFKSIGDGLPALKGLIIQMDAAGTASTILTKQFIALRKEQTGLKVSTAENRAELEKLKKAGDDITLSYNERKEATVQASEIETRTLEENIKLKEKELKIAQGFTKLSADKNNVEALEAENEIRVEIANLSAESLTKQTELTNKLNALNKEYSDRLKASQDKLIAITKKVVEFGNEVKIVSDLEAFEFAKESQIKALQDLQNELKEIAKITGSDVAPQIEILDKAIKGIANTEFVKVLEPLTKELPKVLESIGDNLEIVIDAKVTPPTIEEDEFLEGINTFEDLFHAALDSIFENYDETKVKEFLSGLGEIFSNFGAIANEATAIQVEEIDKELDKLAERKEELQSDLDQELEDQAKGLANNVGNKQDEVNAILAEETRLQEEKDKLQQEALKRQLVFDTLTQTQSLITSSINIIKGFSSIPIVGLPLGIAAVGSMLAFFAKTKADAFKATKLYTGADRVNDHFGFGERHGDTDLPGRGDGYELVNRRTGKGTNTVISGREMLLPENVSISNSEFFHSMRNGLYNGINLNEAMDFYMKHNGETPTKVGGNASITAIQQQKQPIRQYVPYIDKKGVHRAKLVTIDNNTSDGSELIFDQ